VTGFMSCKYPGYVHIVYHSVTKHLY